MKLDNPVDRIECSVISYEGMHTGKIIWQYVLGNPVNIENMLLSDDEIQSNREEEREYILKRLIIGKGAIFLLCFFMGIIFTRFIIKPDFIKISLLFIMLTIIIKLKIYIEGLKYRLKIQML